MKNTGRFISFSSHCVKKLLPMPCSRLQKCSWNLLIITSELKWLPWQPIPFGALPSLLLQILYPLCVSQFCLLCLDKQGVATWSGHTTAEIWKDVLCKPTVKDMVESMLKSLHSTICSYFYITSVRYFIISLDRTSFYKSKPLFLCTTRGIPNMNTKPTLVCHSSSLENLK